MPWEHLRELDLVEWVKNGGPEPTSITHKNYTDVIVSSESIVDNYAEAFGISRDKIHSIGIPRSDMFFDENKKNQAKEELYTRYPTLKNKRVILFAPTFRGNGKKSAYYPVEWFNVQEIYKSLNENDILLIRNHPFIKEKINLTKEQSSKIIDVTDYDDTNKLLIITDVLITDYSSIIFEYALLKRPIIFYTPDLEEYKESRDFYYDFDEYTYGICCKNTEELIEAIQKPIVNTEKLNKFNEKFLNMCDGNATKRFIDYIILQMEAQSATKIHNN